MNAQQLRNSILQEAIEGRLVPQDPNDEPASALLERIREEKRRLVKEGKLKKKDLVETPISEDEKPFEIPESWEWCRVGDISESFIGLTYKPSDVSECGWIVLRSSNIQNGQLDYNDIVKVNIDVPEKLHVKQNDIIICARNGSKKLVGKSAIVRSVDVPTTFGAFMAICRTSFYEYMAKYLLSPLFFAQLRKESDTTTINQLTQKNFNKYLVPLPPLAEQKRIVAKIEELMPKVEEYGKAQEALDKLNAELPQKLKKSILQEAIEGRLVPQDPNDEPASVLLDKIRKEKAQLVKEGKLKKKDLVETPISEDEKPFEIPESWEWVWIGTIFLHSSGKQLKGGDTEGTLHQYITTSNLYWNRFELDALKSMYYKDSELERCSAIKGDLLVCEGGDIGRSAIWPYDYTIFLQNHVHRLRPYFHDYTKYVYYVMWLFKHTGLIGGKGIAIQGLSASALKAIPIPLPPLAEQHRIVAKIEQLFSEINKLEKA